MVETVIVLDLRFGADHLTLTVATRPVLVAGDARTFDVVLEVLATPFSGRVDQVVLEDDLRFFADNLRRMTPSGEVIFGGERMAELVLAVEPQVGGDAGMLVIEASVTATGDHWPRLTMLLPDQRPFWASAGNILVGVLEKTVE